MKPSTILSSLCYFSIFFAPFLFPLLIWLIADNQVKAHAKSALWSHVVPFIMLVLGFIASFSIGIGSMNGVWVGTAIVITYIVYIVVGLYYLIWNVIKGIKVLKEA
ncbi:DUF4870 domain-containing protein [Paenibacillus sp. 1001270B_150601_E10]|uniref:DUF4870 domain-containing protein n=1 Tax=Paenibacillus sp. 1001270B_150601_E10 TaxID=2787079 RepID=UPI00189D16C2|nr:DUF4870 domain-containing protein [Paenibacillus sp. 1001270B_150601_E10]